MQTLFTPTFRWGWLAIPGIMFLFSQPVLAGPEVFRAGPPVEIQQVKPPAEIQRVKPPTEIQKVKPPEEIRRVAPPQEIQRVAPPQGVRQVAPLKDVRQVAPPPAMQVRTPPMPPQLMVRGIGLSNPEPRVGERVTINATLRNDTLRDLSRVRVQFFAGNQPIDNENFVDVPAGKSVSVSAAFTPVAAGAQNVRVQISGAGVAQVGGSQDRPLTVMARPAGEGTPEVASVPPQRLAFDKPKASAPAPDVSRQPRPDYGKKGKGEQGKESPEGSIPWGDRPQSPIPEDLRGQTDVARGPHGEVIGWGDGIYGMDGKGTRVPAPPAGAEELDKALAEAMKGPKPGSEAGGLYGPTRPGIGPGKWADEPGASGPPPADEPHFDANNAGRTMNRMGAKEVFERGAGGDKEVIGLVTRSGEEYAIYANKTGARVLDGDSARLLFADENGRYTGTGWVRVFFGSGQYMTPDTDAKPSPKEPDPNLVLVLMKDPGKRKTDPRIGQVGDPPAMPGKASGEGKGEAVAAGAVKAEAKWQFAGVKPGAFLKGPRDPNLPGGGGAGGGLRPDLRRFILPDPPEAQAIAATLAKTGVAAAPSVTVSDVAGAVQVLATRGGKQGWTPLTAGSKLAANSVIRVDKGTGGEIGVGDLQTAMSMNWTKIHSSTTHTVWQVNVRK